MTTKLKLNDLLNLSEDELKNTKVKFNQWNGETNPIDRYKENPEIMADVEKKVRENFEKAFEQSLGEEEKEDDDDDVVVLVDNK